MKLTLLFLAIVAAIDANVANIVAETDFLKLTIDDAITDLADSTSSHDANCPPAPNCDNKHCHLPGCKCSDEVIPGGVSRQQTPMVVVLSFQNAVQTTNFQSYIDLFNKRKNPNGCPATGTFFVSAKNSNFYDVQILYHNRHEIALNGVEDFTLPTFWYRASVDNWCQQINDSRQILTTWAGVHPQDIHGFRTPFLYMGGETQLEAYRRCGIQYDGTRVAVNRKDEPNLQWPYTYGYKTQANCPQKTCAKCSYPGIWQVPLQALNNSRNFPCAVLTGCKPNTSDDVYDILQQAFMARYRSNRSPMMVSIDTGFMLKDAWLQGLERFLDFAATRKDTYLVSAWQLLNWIKHPKPTSHNSFPCNGATHPVCDKPRDCYYDKDRKFVPAGSPGATIVMTTCAPRCPPCYPGYNDPYGVHCRKGN